MREIFSSRFIPTNLADLITYIFIGIFIFIVLIFPRRSGGRVSSLLFFLSLNSYFKFIYFLSCIFLSIIINFLYKLIITNFVGVYPVIPLNAFNGETSTPIKYSPNCSIGDLIVNYDILGLLFTMFIVAIIYFVFQYIYEKKFKQV